jgi:hypothetical protein
MNAPMASGNWRSFTHLFGKMLVAVTVMTVAEQASGRSISMVSVLDIHKR